MDPTTSFVTSVSEIREHPNFDPEVLTNDISVLLLSTPVDLKSFPNIKPACLPYITRLSDFEQEFGIVSGWGTTGRDGQVPLFHFVRSLLVNNPFRYFFSIVSNKIELFVFKVVIYFSTILFVFLLNNLSAKLFIH